MRDKSENYYECKIKQQKKNLKVAVLVFCIIPLLFILPFMWAVSQISFGSPGGNEATAVASLKAIANAQSVFIKTDFYEINKLVYANPSNGCGISDLYEVGYDGKQHTDNAHKTLDRTVARTDDSLSLPIPKCGYLFHDLECEDYRTQFAALAYPTKYNVTGCNVFVINETDNVYQIDAKVLYPGIKSGDKITPPDKYPTNEELKKWIPAGR